MNNRKRQSRRPGATALGVCLLGLAGASWAGHHENRFPISIADAEARVQNRFEEADRNADDVISRDEFDAVDWGGPDRWPGPGGHRKGPGMMFHGANGEGPPNAADLDRQLFSAMDENDDGMLSPDEFSVSRMHAAGRGIARERIFEHLDGNGDGSLSREELPDPAGRLRSMDDDGDGVVTRAEARKHHRSADRAGADASG